MLLPYDEEQCTECLSGHGLASCEPEHGLSWPYRLADGHRRRPSEVNFWRGLSRCPLEFSRDLDCFTVRSRRLTRLLSVLRPSSADWSCRGTRYYHFREGRTAVICIVQRRSIQLIAYGAALRTPGSVVASTLHVHTAVSDRFMYVQVQLQVCGLVSGYTYSCTGIRCSASGLRACHRDQNILEASRPTILHKSPVLETLKILRGDYCTP